MRLNIFGRKAPPAPRVSPTIQAPAVEAKSLASPSAELLELFGAIPAGNGITVTTEQAIRVPAVSAAIRTISEAASTLDVGVKRIQPDGTEVDDFEHPVAKLVAGDVNEWASFRLLVADLLSDALMHDLGATAYVSRTGDGRIVEIVRYARSHLLVEDVARAREVRALVRSGAVRGLSIGFVTKKAAARAGGGRTITSLELMEVSLVTLPMHPGARVTSAKSAVEALRVAEATHARRRGYR